MCLLHTLRTIMTTIVVTILVDPECFVIARRKCMRLEALTHSCDCINNVIPFVSFTFQCFFPQNLGADGAGMPCMYLFHNVCFVRINILLSFLIPMVTHKYFLLTYFTIDDGILFAFACTKVRKSTCT